MVTCSLFLFYILLPLSVSSSKTKYMFISLKPPSLLSSLAQLILNVSPRKLVSSSEYHGVAISSNLSLLFMSNLSQVNADNFLIFSTATNNLVYYTSNVFVSNLLHPCSPIRSLLAISQFPLFILLPVCFPLSLSVSYLWNDISPSLKSCVPLSSFKLVLHTL